METMLTYKLASTICTQLFRLAGNDGGPPITFCALHANGAIVLQASMDEASRNDIKKSWMLAKTALHIGGYTENLVIQGVINVGSVTPSFFLPHGGGIVVRAGAHGNIVCAFGVSGRSEQIQTQLRSNHDLAFWAANLVAGTHAVSTLEEYKRLWNKGTLPSEVKAALRQETQAQELVTV